ncbi:ArsR/SmtB family transcription factor [Kitasatospora sp. LaBMicrA B282]|uniref:ArsR/SmtB family transcription factor n=1 Tax=Kitasatospora sp. LaBMicrA B282 TaxID=3420949 RepID=UPI003D0CCAF9
MIDDADQRLPEPATADIRLVGVLHALADPVRLRIARELAAGHELMSCIAFSLPVSKSTSTHHFRVLREAGVIRQYRRGTARLSSLRHDDLAARFPGLLDRVLAAAEAELAQQPAAAEAGPKAETETEAEAETDTGTTQQTAGQPELDDIDV